MEEGASHLEEAREREVNGAISAMGITRIIVAYRKKTIASAERVYVLDRGRLRGQDQTTISRHALAATR